MASIRYSATGGEIKGKINGTVYQGGKSGPIVKRLLHRSFVRIAALIYGVIASTNAWAGSEALGSTALPNFLYPDGSHVANGKVADQRSVLSNMSASWKTLTPEQRAAWNAAAVNFPFKNKFGDQYTGSGFQVYQQLNLNLVTVNETANVFPPMPDLPVLPEITPPNGESDDPLLYTFPDGIPEGQNILVYSSVGQSAGRQIKAKNLKLIGVLQGGTAAGTINLRPMWQLFFGMVNAGSAVQVTFEPVSKTTGQKGAPFISVELFDAVSAGAKLTKADAALAFGDVPSTPTTHTTSFFAVNYAPGIRIELTGAAATELELSTNDSDYGNPEDVLTNQWGNINNTTIYIRTNWTSAGAKTANLVYKTIAGVTIATVPITANVV